MREPLDEQDLVTFLIGGLGSGKTELAINLAIRNCKRFGPGKSFLLDLDIVNPFFRVRKVREDLEEAGVEVVTPDERVQYGDLPALSAGIWSAFDRPDVSIVCDVGGGEIGLRPLARLTDLAPRRKIVVLCVVNPFRPGFLSADQIIASLKQFSDISALKITHIVPNPHLVGETTLKIFQDGYEKVRMVAEKVGLPIPFSIVSSGLAHALGEQIAPPLKEGESRFVTLGEIPVFAIRRFWEKPWQLGFSQGKALVLQGKSLVSQGKGHDSNVLHG